jgi:hypothetical protein
LLASHAGTPLYTAIYAATAEFFLASRHTFKGLGVKMEKNCIADSYAKYHRTKRFKFTSLAMDGGSMPQNPRSRFQYDNLGHLVAFRYQALVELRWGRPGPWPAQDFS